MSGSLSSAFTLRARTPYCAAFASARSDIRSAQATISMSAKPVHDLKYWSQILPQPMIPTWAGVGMALPFALADSFSVIKTPWQQTGGQRRRTPSAALDGDVLAAV